MLVQLECRFDSGRPHHFQIAMWRMLASLDKMDASPCAKNIFAVNRTDYWAGIRMTKSHSISAKTKHSPVAGELPPHPGRHSKSGPRFEFSPRIPQ
jgi:hypothetical protein